VLGGILVAQKKYPEAEPLLTSGYEGLKQRQERIPPTNKACLKDALQRLTDCYQAMGRKDEAAKLLNP
jgi:lipopolysaccharide biosynthesis regulator YciM